MSEPLPTPDAEVALREAREELLDVDGLRIARLEWGPRDGAPVVCLHGWLDNAASFAPLAPFLADVRLIAIDLPGHGASDHRPPGASYHTLDWVGDVLRVADALALDAFALVGHSMGAGIAALVAGTAPKRVARLALVEGVGSRGHRPEDFPERAAAWLEEEREARSFPDRRRPALFETAVRARLANRAIARSSVELLTLRGTELVEGGVLWRHDRALQRTRPPSLEEHTVRAFLRRIACPTLLVTAREGERWLSAEDAAERTACIPDLRRVEVDGAHHVHMDEPARVAEHLVPFLG